MTEDYRELNKVISPLFAAMPNVASLLDQLSHDLGTYHYVLDLANAFFSIDIDPESQDLHLGTLPVDTDCSASVSPAQPYCLPWPCG